MMDLMRLLSASLADEDGQGMVEYALIITGIALVALVGINLLGPVISTFFTNISTGI